ncbi:ion transporter [Winogradskyella sp. UBA3174]|uniref:ion transporter n=1 Tax=Winogradskyella sp. UBA3174 TaxID=1947785 RepID=UPI0025CF71A5|nr:ion transporter [Winogradskyella sp. UBA3174]|tara:strand:- start:6743 stop:7633 length:891 start_codon:yes stop_codon:yes gene_type:complete
MESNNKHTWKTKLHEIIYEADTPIGKVFDVLLLVFILLSIVLVMLESVNSIDKKYHELLYIGEWVVTILFSLEYILRIVSVKKPLKYIFSFFGIIDFLSTIPMYLAFFFAGSQALVTLRALRLLRVFRILKLARYLGASNQLKDSIIASRLKIMVFLFAIMISSVIFGTIMYLVEGEANGFDNIPKSVYWCVVTLTTVGFGDIAPQTALGQLITTFIMILGYGIIAVPTGIVSAEYVRSSQKADKENEDLKNENLNKQVDSNIAIHLNSQHCDNCNVSNHRDNSDFCYNCGHQLHH